MRLCSTTVQLNVLTRRHNGTYLEGIMKITEENRLAAAEELREKQGFRKAMPKQVAVALARGRCKDCDLPWDAVEVGGHVPQSEGWVCHRCFRYQKTGISLVLGGARVEVESRGRCANKACGRGRDPKGKRVRAKVPKVGDFCSNVCKMIVKDAAKQTQRAKAV